MLPLQSSSAPQVKTPPVSHVFLQVYSQVLLRLQPHSPGHLMGAFIAGQSQAVLQAGAPPQAPRTKREITKREARSMAGGDSTTCHPRDHAPSRRGFRRPASRLSRRSPLLTGCTCGNCSWPSVLQPSARAAASPPVAKAAAKGRAAKSQAAVAAAVAVAEAGTVVAAAVAVAAVAIATKPQLFFSAWPGMFGPRFFFGGHSSTGSRTSQLGIRSGVFRETFMDDHSSIEGPTVAVLPRTMFRVQQDNDHEVLAVISGRVSADGVAWRLK